MKLPIYTAISFNRIIEKGGHSKPWIVSVNADGTLKPYVIKLYRTLDIEARNKMTAEIFGNLMASEFDLNSPSPAIIDFTEDFRMSLNTDCEEILSLLDERAKFGTEYIEGAFLFAPQIPKEEADKIIPMDSLYAFDYFICNRDRTLQKPNLLVKNGYGILIDHEMALEIDENTLAYFNKGKWNEKYQYHLFYDKLKASTYEEKQCYFEEFETYLQMLRLNKFDEVFIQLKDLGFNNLNEDLLKSYFLAILHAPRQFINILKQSIE